MLAAALNYAERGWHVIPLHDVTAGTCSCVDGAGCPTPGKHPRITKWQHREAPTRRRCRNGGGAGRQQTSASPPVHAPGYGCSTSTRATAATMSWPRSRSSTGRLRKLSRLSPAAAAWTTTSRTPAARFAAAHSRPASSSKPDGTFVVAPPSGTGEAREPAAARLGALLTPRRPGTRGSSRVATRRRCEAAHDELPAVIRDGAWHDTMVSAAGTLRRRRILRTGGRRRARHREPRQV